MKWTEPFWSVRAAHGVGGRHADGPVGDCRGLGRIDLPSRKSLDLVLLFRQKGINESIIRVRNNRDFLPVLRYQAVRPTR
jgi:hypothetical protein